MVEEDAFGGDDILGRNKYEKFSYDNIIDNTFPTVVFSESGQEIVARDKIEVLRIDEHPELN